MATTTGWRWKETAGAVGIATVIAALGGVAIYAATESSSQIFAPPHQAFGQGGPGGQHGVVGAPVGATALHGEFVVSDSNGG